MKNTDWCNSELCLDYVLLLMPCLSPAPPGWQATPIWMQLVFLSCDAVRGFLHHYRDWRPWAPSGDQLVQLLFKLSMYKILSIFVHIFKGTLHQFSRSKRVYSWRSAVQPVRADVNSCFNSDLIFYLPCKFSKLALLNCSGAPLNLKRDTDRKFHKDIKLRNTWCVET